MVQSTQIIEHITKYILKSYKYRIMTIFVCKETLFVFSHAIFVYLDFQQLGVDRSIHHHKSIIY